MGCTSAQIDQQWRYHHHLPSIPGYGKIPTTIPSASTTDGVGKCTFCYRRMSSTSWMNLPFRRLDDWRSLANHCPRHSPQRAGWDESRVAEMGTTARGAKVRCSGWKSTDVALPACRIRTALSSMTVEVWYTPCIWSQGT